MHLRSALPKAIISGIVPPILVVIGLHIFWPDLFWAGMAFTKEYSEAITALGTIAIASFTFILWWSTDKLWRSSETTLRMTQRAFVFLDGFDTELTLMDDNESNRKVELQTHKDRGLFVTYFAVQPRWSNSGDTPTNNMVLQTNCTLLEGKLPEDFDYFYPGPKSQMFIGPKSVVAGEVIEMGGANQVINDGMGSNWNLYIWGEAGYDDIFGERHYVKWCYRVRFHRFDSSRLRASYIQHDDHNESG